MKGVKVGSTVAGGVEVPFSAICGVNRQGFAGTVTVTWGPRLMVPEYGEVGAIVARATRRPTTCEALAVRVHRALRRDFRGVGVRVDVTSQAHFRAWAVVS